ncbi:hypothetical protein [Burkholderia sp. TSV86]|uniref:hypothetical protein n=1 Tax=Burkholderia sp. TSV86 TaxID=1385594 RepID=UPI000752C42B|nr:hypothetical protein [Burkholderia sp. TSV86]KVE35930.1 hypothetical protein WS68_05605 [Burkholderia sp. TSV86]
MRLLTGTRPGGVPADTIHTQDFAREIRTRRAAAGGLANNRLAHRFGIDSGLPRVASAQASLELANLCDIYWHWSPPTGATYPPTDPSLTAPRAASPA